MEVQFYRHFAATSKTTFTLYARVKYDGHRAELGSTGLKLQTEDFDTTTKRVLPTHRQHDLLNKQIEDLIDQLELSFRIVSKGGTKQVTANSILTCYRDVFESAKQLANKEEPVEKEEESKSEVFNEILTAWIDSRELQMKKGEIRYSTFKKTREAVTKVCLYLTETGKEAMKGAEFTIRSAHRYQAWLVDKGYGYAHINKLLKAVRQAVRWAYEHEYLDIDSLAGLRLKRDILPIPPFLTVSQVEDLKTRPFASPVLQKVADLMVIYCRTGFHYTDLKLVIRAAKEKISAGLAGHDWIEHDRIKTGVTAKVPVFEGIKSIIEKYGGWDKLPLLSNDKMNYFLKVIAAERGLNPKLSVKFGRNSLADWLLNEKGWGYPAVKVVMGIRTDAMLNRYVRADERHVALQLKKRKKK